MTHWGAKRILYENIKKLRSKENKINKHGISNSVILNFKSFASGPFFVPKLFVT